MANPRELVNHRIVYPPVPNADKTKFVELGDLV